jgi:protein SCO1/2
MMSRSSLFIKALFLVLGLAALTLGGWLLFATPPAEGQSERKAIAPFVEAAYQVHKASFDVPDLTLITHNDEQVLWSDLLLRDKPVFVQFIFTSCPTICPVLSAEFAQLQKLAGTQAQLVSVSIDPEYDRPERLTAYGEKFDAGPGWTFVTGSKEDIIHLQEVFDSYEGNKMYHRPVTFLKMPGSQEWVIFDGFIGGKEMWEEVNSKSQNVVLE